MAAWDVEAGTQTISLRTLLTAGPLGFPTFGAERLTCCVVSGPFMEAWLLVVSWTRTLSTSHMREIFSLNFVFLISLELDRCQCNGPLYNRMFTDCGTSELAFRVQVSDQREAHSLLFDAW